MVTLGSDHCRAPARPTHLTHLTLRPGVPVLARSPGILQVGLDEPAVRVADVPVVRTVLGALARPGGVPTSDGLEGAAVDVLERLDRAGLLVEIANDERRPDPCLGVLRAQFGSDAVRRHAARTATGVVVTADPSTAATLERIIGSAGLHHVSADDRSPVVHLIVTSGPLDRAHLDPLVRGSVPHLLVSGTASRRRVGPFVEPGLTACLRCVDAHETLHDPRRPLLLTQAAAIAVEYPPPQDPVLDQIVLAWAVRDLVRYVEGDEPSTWSTTIDLGPVASPEVTRWGRHPECGCAWDAITELP